ncbi:MAG: hypothetical protein KDB02_10065 [Acidimicrobiales bacterium]|nr:hypothetical protein [Acidimicrobiales bacterium]
MSNKHHASRAFAAIAVTAMLLAGCGSSDSSKAAATDGTAKPAAQTTVTQQGSTNDGASPAAVKLRTAVHQLWAEHMQWTFATVDAFFHDEPAVEPYLNRLLRNQTDIGSAIEPYYGKDAAKALGDLLTEHIKLAVPVLKAAQAGDKPALDKALSDWKANAQDVADFLSKADPENWPQSATRPMLESHIDQTTTYATDLLKGDYESAVKHYDEAYSHMMMLADTLTDGLVAKFPAKFGY